MPKKLKPGELPKLSVSVALNSDVLKALDANVAAIKAKLATSFDWPDEKFRDKVVRGVSRSAVIAELCEFLSTKDGAEMFWLNMKQGVKLMGIKESNQSNLFD